jgi:hypothetical protein
MGVQGPGPFQYRALKALCPELVFPILSHRLLRHACVRPSYTFDSLRPGVYVATIEA